MRMPVLVLILAVIVAPLEAQQKQAQQPTNWAVVSTQTKKLTKPPEHADWSTRTTPTLKTCNDRIHEASSLLPLMPGGIDWFLYTATSHGLTDCVLKRNLSPAAIRSIVNLLNTYANSYIDSEYQAVAQEQAAARAARNEAEATKKMLADSRTQLDGLNTLYKGLQGDYAAMTQERNKLASDTARYNRSFEEETNICMQSIAQAVSDGMRAGRQTCPQQSYSPVVRCRSEIVGYALQTVCQ